MKGFYVYYSDPENDRCPECGKTAKEIVGFFKGEPDKKVIEKIAIKKFEEDYGRKPNSNEYIGEELYMM